MDPAMFSVANMFGSDSGDDEDDSFVERDHSFPGVVLRIREFAFHQMNANLLWPGSTIFAKWILDHKELITDRRVLELGSGTGALAIFLKKTLQVDITTSDYDDVDIENNIKKNCQLNGLVPLPHVRHTWGEDFPYACPDWDLIIASDILLYVKQYPNLIQTLSHLLKGYNIGHTRQNESATEHICADVVIDHRSSSSLKKSTEQRPNALAVSGPISGSVSNISYLTIESASTCSSESRAVDILGLLLTSPELAASVDGSPPGASIQEPAVSTTLTFLQGICLPRPCFLMSWRRRIPKQDEALFFEGCKTAGLNVTDFGSRIYCVH